jgi:hypothetical protein
MYTIMHFFSYAPTAKEGGLITPERLRYTGNHWRIWPKH